MGQREKIVWERSWARIKTGTCQLLLWAKQTHQGKINVIDCQLKQTKKTIKTTPFPPFSGSTSLLQYGLFHLPQVVQAGRDGHGQYIVVSLCYSFLLTLSLCSSVNFPWAAAPVRKNLLWHGFSTSCSPSGISSCSGVGPPWAAGDMCSPMEHLLLFLLFLTLVFPLLLLTLFFLLLSPRGLSRNHVKEIPSVSTWIWAFFQWPTVKCLPLGALGRAPSISATVGAAWAYAAFLQCLYEDVQKC